jgi:hypothetical protein
MDEGQPINLRLQVAIMGNICIGAAVVILLFLLAIEWLK